MRGKYTRMRYVAQPKGSSLCAHACLAMVLDIELAAAVELMGHQRGTVTRELVKALGARAGDTRLRTIRSKGPFPDFCILRVRWNRRRGHFVIHDKGTVYDPDAFCPAPLRMWLDWIARHKGVVTSVLAIRRSTAPAAV